MTGWRQQGASLVSLMIGMLVSMLGILAVMTMHKSLMQVAVESKGDAIHDAMVSTALMQMQMDLHNAGYGIESGSAGDVVATQLSGAESLLWRYRDGGSFVCKGVTEQSYTDSESGTVGRQLVAIEATSNCTGSADLSTLTWTATETMAQFRNETAALFDFSVATASCAPYGFGVAEDHLRVTVSARSSAEVAGASVSTVAYQYCLANTYI